MEDQELVSTGPPMTGKTRFYLPSFGIGCLGSVVHSPLPLQSFLPLVVPQPPLPLQEFRLLQACFSFLPLDAFLPESLWPALSPPVFCAIALAVVPATNPERAAPISSARIDFVMCTTPFLSSLRCTRGRWIGLFFQQQAIQDSSQENPETLQITELLAL